VTVSLQHGKVTLALHSLREGRGRALLLLHALGKRSPETLPSDVGEWPGPVWALDFTGHGESSVPRGGGYTAELLMGDADAALAHLGKATLLGQGLGAYAALLLAGARPRQTRGAILCDGSGLCGGGARPASVSLAMPLSSAGGPPDPFALLELSRDLRPPDYATSFLRQANHLSGLPRPVSVCCRERPEWLRAVVAEPGVEETSLAEALAHHAATA
jgi:pimeloyl-ACP methyl ester carboxylesterase